MDNSTIRNKLNSPDYENLKFSLETALQMVNSGFKVQQEAIKNQTILANDIQDLEAAAQGMFVQNQQLQGFFANTYVPEVKENLNALNSQLLSTQKALHDTINLIAETQQQTEAKLQELAEAIQKITPKEKLKL
jgi:predicted  nucleic acid-binding Zn-ribbon protein